MMKRMWYELNILALRKHVRPVSLFLLVHTLLWCDLTWLKSAEPAINRPMIIHYIRPAECTENQWNVVCKWQE